MTTTRRRFITGLSAAIAASALPVPGLKALPAEAAHKELVPGAPWSGWVMQLLTPDGDHICWAPLEIRSLRQEGLAMLFTFMDATPELPPGRSMTVGRIEAWLDGEPMSVHEIPAVSVETHQGNTRPLTVSFDDWRVY